MRIAVVKPDWRIRGGYELVVGRVEADLRAAGHDVVRVEVDVPSVPHRPFGVPVPDRLWASAPEWFGHMSLLAHFRELRVPDADLVISTQPPSYAVRHPRHLAFFYHHARAFYDLEDVWVRGGRAHDGLHRAAAAMLRSAEADDLAQVDHVLAGSPRVLERLRQWGPDRPSSLYLAPAPVVADADAEPGSYVLVVSRHEFTKRTELAVQALALGDVPGVLVGDGGRLPFVTQLASRIATGSADAATLPAEQTWLHSGQVDGGAPGAGLAQVRFAGRVDDDELAALYRGALCVLAPAYDEDHGLTVLEAMAHGRPVVVCRDGGGLTASVQDGVNGFVVEPDAAAIAAALGRLAADPSLARRLGEAGLRTAAEHTPGRARDQLLAAVDAVMSGGGR